MLLFLGCGGCGAVRSPAEDQIFDKTCDVDDDCVVVAYAGCGPCGSCGDLAINTAARAAFDEANQVSCPPSPPSSVVCGACPELRATCEAGGCLMVDCSVDGCAIDG